MNSLRLAWERAFTRGFADEDIRRAKFIGSFTLVGGVSLASFALFHWVSGEILPAMVEGSLALASALSIYLFIRSKNVLYATHATLLIALVTFFFLLLHGGIANTGIFWFFIFPVIAFSLEGPRRGALWSALVLLEILVASLLSALGFVTLANDFITLRQLAASFAAVALATYFYQTIHTEGEEKLRSRTEALIKEVARRETLEKSLARAIEDTQSKNESLENTTRAMLNVLEDLGEEKRRVEEEEVRDHALLESIGEGLIALDSRGYLQRMSKTAERMLGWTFPELTNGPFADLIPMLDSNKRLIPRHEHPLIRALEERAAVRNSGPSDMQYYVCKDGTTLPISVTTTPVLLGQELVGAIQIFRDMTEEERLERNKSDFVALASHQLRTPLTTIKWFSEMLLSGDARTKAAEMHYLKEINAGTDRMENLIAALLDASRLELGTVAVRPSPVPLAEYVGELLRNISKTYTSKRIALLERYEPLEPLPCDRDILYIVIRALIRNAYMYTPEGGRIEVSLSARGIDKRGQEGVVVSVVDTGYGIPNDEQSHIFSKLYRGTNIRSKDTTGAGLGLYIARLAMLRCGGDIWFESTEGKGSSFHIWLPRDGMRSVAGKKRVVV